MDQSIRGDLDHRPPPPPPPKRRIRTISNLTQEQIRKKRDNDREAQRAFRERTRLRIHVLEDELAVLKSERSQLDDSNTSELQTLREENRTLKFQIHRFRQLANPLLSALTEDGNAAVSDNFQPEYSSGPEVHHSASDAGGTHAMINAASDETTPWQSPNPRPIIHRSTDQAESIEPSLQQERSYPDPMVAQTLYYKEHHHPASFAAGSSDHEQQVFRSGVQNMDMDVEIHEAVQARPYQRAPPQSSTLSPSHPDSHAQGSPISSIAPHQRQAGDQQRQSATMGVSQYPIVVHHENFNSNQPATNHSPNRLSNDRGLVHDSSSQQSSPHNHRETERVADDYLDGVVTNVPSLEPHSTTSEASYSPNNTSLIPSTWVQSDSMAHVSTFTILPKHLSATCPLDQILLDFLSSRRLLAAQGTPASALIGPLRPSISGLVNPKFKTAVHASSRVMVDIVSTFKDTNIIEQLGFLSIMYATMRWQIAPSQETFESLPAWLHPTVLQVMVPHAAWIDNIPWPRVRDLLIQDPRKYIFQDFSELYAREASLNWPFDAADAVMSKGESSDEVMMNPLFEKHLQKLESWSVGELFKERFPELAAAIKS